MKLIRQWEQRQTARLRPGVCSLDFGGDEPSPPAPDPQIGQAALANAGLSREMVDLAREQWSTGQARVREYDPIVKEHLGLQAQAARENLARANAQWNIYNEQAGLQTQAARDNIERAGAQWNIYDQEYRPVERRMVADAMDWDSASALDRAVQEAGAGTERANAASRDAVLRDLASRGVNPNSGRFASTAASLGLAGAISRANAENMAREGRRAQGVQLRSGAAQFGRNMPQTGIAAGSLGLQASGMPQSGLATGALGLQASGNAVGTASGLAMMPGQLAGQVQPWYTGAVGANTAGGNLLLGQYQGQLGAWGQQLQADAASSAGLGNLLGTGLGMWAKAGFPGPWGGSSEKIKEDKEPVSGALILQGIEEIPVEQWRYKRGTGDGGKHIGPYAEDVQAQFGDAAAPGGMGLDLMTMNGLAMAAIKELAKKVRKLEGSGKSGGGSREMGLEMVLSPGRDTEPRRVG